MTDQFLDEYETRMVAAVASLSPRWGVKGYRAHRTRDGVAFVFVLTDGGREVASVEDSGTGGGAWPLFTPSARESRDAFTAEAARLFPADVAFAGESMIEAVLRKAGK